MSVDTVLIRGQSGQGEQKRLCRVMADLHAAAFPGFFLTSLGPPFLRRLYAGFMTQPDGICLVAEDAGNVVGFVTGTMNPSGFFRHLLRQQALGFAFAAVPGVLRSPLFTVRKCLGAVFYRGEAPGGLPDAVLLSSLAVSPVSQGKGVGQSLVQGFADEVRRRGGKAIYLTTDEAENEQTNRFYARCNFELLDTFSRPGNRLMNRWIMRLILKETNKLIPS